MTAKDSGYQLLIDKILSGEALSDDDKKAATTCISIVARHRYDKALGVPFICGRSGEVREGDNLPEYFWICPAYGSDAVSWYKRVDRE